MATRRETPSSRLFAIHVALALAAGCGAGDTPAALDGGPEGEADSAPDAGPDAEPEDGGGCVPDCEGHECGGDGCGGWCGRCTEPEVCTPEFLCEEGSLYYFSDDGDDAAPGTMEEPKRTLAELAALELSPGARVHLRRGDTFPGTIVARPGAPGSPVVYRSWTDPNHFSPKRPVVSGALSIESTDWTRLEGDDPIYVKTGVVIEGLQPLLAVDGELMHPSRHPDTGVLVTDGGRGVNEGSHCCEAATAFRDADLPFDPSDVVGALLTHYDAFSSESTVIEGHAAGWYTFPEFAAHLLSEPYYYLSYRLAFLDGPGQFAYHAEDQALYLWLPDGSAPDGHVIEASGLEVGLSGEWGRDDFEVHDLAFRLQRDTGVRLAVNDRVVVSGCSFSQSPNGVRAYGSGMDGEEMVDLRIEGNELDEVLTRGIVLERRVRDCAVTDNLLTNVGTVLEGGYGRGIGISVVGVDTEVSGNQVERSGFMAINPAGSGLDVARNVIDWPCLNFGDCGGIYSGWSNPVGPSTIRENLVRHSHGWDQDGLFRWHFARGIYNDFHDDDTIRGNVVDHCDVGIGLTNTRDTRVEGNVVYGSLQHAFRMNRKTAESGLGNTIVDNVFFGLVPVFTTGLTSGPSLVYWDNQLDDVDDDSRFDRNAYWSPYAEFPVFRYRRRADPRGTWFQEEWSNLQEWRDSWRGAQDSGSTAGWSYANVPFADVSPVGAEQIDNGGFESGTAGWLVGGSVVTATPAGVPGMNGNALRFEYVGGWVFGSLFHEGLEIEEGHTYRLSFRLRADAGMGDRLFGVIAYDEEGEVFDRAFTTVAETRLLESVFVAPRSTTVTLWFDFQEGDGRYLYLDDVSFREVSAVRDDPRGRYPLVVNVGDEPRDFPLSAGETWRTLDGEIARGTVRVPPWSATVLVRDE